MFRALRTAFLAVLALVLIALALANRETVTLRILPPEAGDFLGFSWSVHLPLFLVIFAGIVLGLLIGFVWEWMREYRIRTTATRQAREVTRLKREVSRLATQKHGPKDEVLALLEEPGRKR